MKTRGPGAREQDSGEFGFVLALVVTAFMRSGCMLVGGCLYAFAEPNVTSPDPMNRVTTNFRSSPLWLMGQEMPTPAVTFQISVRIQKCRDGLNFGLLKLVPRRYLRPVGPFGIAVQDYCRERHHARACRYP